MLDAPASTSPIVTTIDLGYTKDDEISSAYTIAFVYNNSGNYAVKGNHKGVRMHVINHLSPCIYHLTYWRNGRHRASSWMSSQISIFIEKFKLGAKTRYKISITTKDGAYRELFVCRRIPNRWLPVYDLAKVTGESIV